MSLLYPEIYSITFVPQFTPSVAKPKGPSKTRNRTRSSEIAELLEGRPGVWAAIGWLNEPMASSFRKYVNYNKLTHIVLVSEKFCGGRRFLYAQALKRKV